MTPKPRHLLALLGVLGIAGLGTAGVQAAQQPAAPNRSAARQAPARPRAGQRRALRLTPEQQKKVQALRADYNRRFLEILTPEQRQQWQQSRQNRRARAGTRRGPGARRKGMARANGAAPRRAGVLTPAAMRSLNLTSTQQSQVQTARIEMRTALRSSRSLPAGERKAAAQAAREKFRSVVERVLTPAQREQLRKGG